jgi:hypothetical protein
VKAQKASAEVAQPAPEPGRVRRPWRISEEEKPAEPGTRVIRPLTFPVLINVKEIQAGLLLSRPGLSTLMPKGSSNEDIARTVAEILNF